MKDKLNKAFFHQMNKDEHLFEEVFQAKLS